MSRLADLSLYYHTVSHLQRAQLLGTLERKLYDATVPRLPLDLNARYERRIPTDLEADLDALAANTDVIRASLPSSVRADYRSDARAAAEGDVTFMNRTVERPGWTAETDERLASLPRLWRLKLHAFEPLWWTVLGFTSAADARAVTAALDEWAMDWYESVGVGAAGYLRGAWAPYTVSLRLLYVLRYRSWRNEGADNRWLRLAYRDAAFLGNHVERDVGGNHLVENGAALVVAGVCFDEPRWVEEGTAVLETAARTQFLPDGGHFERSPMYHVQTLTRYLSVVDLLGRTGRRVPEALEEVTQGATDFLAFLRPPDGRLPLLNDAVYGQTLTLDSCLAYATRVGARVPGDESTLDAADGYHWLRNDGGAMLVDGGPLGPAHLPGHSHLDLLSVLLWVDGSPVLTDTGVFDYESGADRRYARGVRAHNTVQIDDDEPVDIGGRFLMGRRPTLDTVRDGPRFEGQYEARPAAGTPFTHHRLATVGEDWWLVWDTVKPALDRTVHARLHVHPDVAVTEHGDHAELGRGPDPGALAWVAPLNVDALTVTEGPYFPEFGIRKERPVLRFNAAAEADRARGFGCVVSTHRLDDREVSVSEREIRIGDTTVRRRGLDDELLAESPTSRHGQARSG
jgi:uncharacterized heparinase superfamily protein